ncbi:MAG: hypothetical protein AB7O88_00645 [Reyranellaceae bacterium]
MRRNIDVSLPFLNLRELTEASVAVVRIHGRVAKAIARLNAEVAAKRDEISNRWKRLEGVTPADRQRMAERETAAAVSTIRENCEKELIGLMREVVEAERRVTAQEFFYDSPVKLLARLELGTAARSNYLAQLQAAGPVEVAHLGQYAASIKEKALGAAVLSVLDAMPTTERPFTAVSLAESIVGGDFKQAREAIRVARNRTQEAVIAIRSFRAARNSPLASVRMAVSRLSEDGSIELEAAKSA